MTSTGRTTQKCIEPRDRLVQFEHGRDASKVLIQVYRDTAAIHAKLDEIIVSLAETRNNVVGLEHSDPKEIAATVEKLEKEAEEVTDAQVNGCSKRNPRLTETLDATDLRDLGLLS